MPIDINKGKIISRLVTTLVTLYLLYRGGPLTTLAEHINIPDLTVYRILDISICSKLAERFGEMAEGTFATYHLIQGCYENLRKYSPS